MLSVLASNRRPYQLSGIDCDSSPAAQGLPPCFLVPLRLRGQERGTLSAGAVV